MGRAVGSIAVRLLRLAFPISPTRTREPENIPQAAAHPKYAQAAPRKPEIFCRCCLSRTRDGLYSSNALR
jgi:hypothetical protein